LLHYVNCSGIEDNSNPSGRILMWRVLRQIDGFAQNAGVDNFYWKRDQARPSQLTGVRMPEYTWAE